MLPVIARNLIESIELLANASTALAQRCVAGLVADRDRMRSFAQASSAIVTALNPIVGYERAASFVKEAEAKGVPVIDVVLEHGVMARDELEKALDVLAMTRPGELG
jgi:fumarate hydratase class II